MRYDQDPTFSGEFPVGGSINAHDQMSAPGSPGDDASETYGGEIGRPVISTLFDSSQVPANLVRVSVLSGDTSSMSSDQSVPTNIGGVTVVGADRTGAGQGGVGHVPHPNSAGTA